MALADKDTYLILEDEASFNVVADTDLFANAASGFMSLGFSAADSANTLTSRVCFPVAT